MASSAVLNRVALAHKMILEGVTKRKAYRDAHTDNDTYLRLVDTDEFKKFYGEFLKTGINDFEDIKKGFKLSSDIESGAPKKRGRPRKLDMKKIKLEVYLDPKYIEILEKEAIKKGLPLRLHVASYIVEQLNGKYPDLN